jgi:YD repeat-containing protein
MKKLFILFLVTLIEPFCIEAQSIKTYQFDNLGRIDNVTNPNVTTITYQYDEVGNRIGMIVTSNQTTDISNEISQLGVKLYPNPASESFCISGFEGTALITIRDISCKTLLTKQIIANENISVNNFPKGVYIVKIINDEGTVERKLIKNRS